MSTSLGNDWTDETPSQSRFTAKTLFVGPGSDIGNITTQNNCPLALCTEDGGGFFKNNLYARHYDDTTAQWTGWDNAKWKHTHTDNADDGGAYYEMDVANIERIHDDPPYLTVFQFFGAKSGTGADIADANANSSLFLRLRTGVVANNYAYIAKGGTRLSFAYKIEWHVKMEVDGGNAQILWRAGPGMELPQDNADVVEKKIGLEGCTGSGTKVQVVNCDGVTRLITPTTIDMDTGQARGFMLKYVPSTNLTYKDTLASNIVVSANIPGSGYILSDRLVRYGIKTTNTTEKLMYLWRHALFGKSNDSDYI